MCLMEDNQDFQSPDIQQTEPESVSRKLQHAQNLMARAQRIGHFGVWEWNPSTNEVIWSDEMYKIFGIAPGTVIDTDTTINAFHPDDRDKVIEMTKIAIQTKKPQDVDARILLPDGSVRYVHGTGESELDEQGNILRMYGYYLDVTDIRQAFTRIVETEKFYESLIRKAPDGVVLIGMDGQFKYTSPAARKMFGFSDTDIIQVHPDDYTHPEDLPAVLAALSKVIANPDYAPTLEYRFRMKSGTYAWVESTFTNMLSEPGVEGIVINFRKIDDRKKALLALKKSEEKFSKIFKSSPYAIAITRIEDGVIVDINDATGKLFGFSVDEVIGKSSL